MSPANERLREHITSTAFNLTLSKAMIRALVRQDLVREHDYCTNGFQPRPRGQANPDNYIATLHALEDRGLVEWNPQPLMFRGDRRIPQFVARRMKKYGVRSYEVQDPRLLKLTRAGRIIVSLLKEAAIYEGFAEKIRPLSADPAEASS